MEWELDGICSLDIANCEAARRAEVRLLDLEVPHVLCVLYSAFVSYDMPVFCTPCEMFAYLMICVCVWPGGHD